MRISCLGFGLQNEKLPCNESNGYKVPMGLICFLFLSFLWFYLFLSLAGMVIDVVVVHVYVLRLKIPIIFPFYRIVQGQAGNK